MKKIIVTGFILALCMLIIPFAVPKNNKKTAPGGAKVTSASAKVEEIPAKEENGEAFRIKTKDKVVSLSAKEYTEGVVAAEMPVAYGAEALKAQSVAAYSFALYRKEHNKNADYDLTDSYKTDQSYLGEQELKDKWGDSYQANIEKIRSAVEAVSGEYLSYNGKPALTLYHALSCGKTNPCADVFGSEVPYLVSVNSKSDALSPDCKSEIKIKEDDLSKKLAGFGSGNKDAALRIGKTGEGGSVKEVKLGGKSVSGAKFAALLELPSPNFTVKHSSGTYIFICMGKGHGVGMSQYGANAMAAEGKTWREILEHYYTGCEIVKN